MQSEAGKKALSRDEIIKLMFEAWKPEQKEKCQIRKNGSMERIMCGQLRALLSENLVALESDKKEPVFFESEKVNVIFWYKISDGIKNNVKKLKKVLDFWD